MVENINVKDLFDENHNGKIEKQELEKLGFEIETKKQKDELDRLGTKIQLEAIKNSIDVDKAISKAVFIPSKYKQEIIKVSDKEEKIGYFYLFQISSKILGNKAIENIAKEGIPLDEITLFLYELVSLEKEKDTLETAAISLTLEEIKELKETILVDHTKQKLKEFIKEQLEENISSAEVVKGTKLAKKIEQAGYNPISYMKNLDMLSMGIWKSQKLNISEDSIHNMGTGLTVAFMKLYNLNPKEIKISPKNLVIAPKHFIGIKNISKAIKELGLNSVSSENNDLLMNPELFSNFVLKVINNNLNINQIKEELQKNQRNSHSKYNKGEIIKNFKDIFNQTGEKISTKDVKEVSKIQEVGGILRGIKEGINGIKQQGKDLVEENKGFLFEIKSICEELGIWKIVKEIIDWILKFLGYENGWDDIEKKVENKQEFDNVISYLKEKTSLEEIKKNDKSIFHKGFKENLKENSDKKIEQVSVKGNLSQRSLYYLSSLGNTKDSIYTNLDSLFESENFKSTLEKAGMKEEDFYKKVFSTKELEKDGKKVNIGEINMTELSKVIEKAYKKEIDKIIDEKAKEVEEKYLSPKKGLTLNKLDKEDKEKIEKFVAEKEKEFKSLVSGEFGISDFSYTAYLNGIGYIESRHRYNLTNGIGAMGKYQFMPYTIKGYKNIIGNFSQSKLNKVFLSNPFIQEKVMAEYTKNQLLQIKSKIKSRVSNGADIAFYLAKSHLGGAGAVLKNRSDGNITQNKYAKVVKKVYKGSEGSNLV